MHFSSSLHLFSLFPLALAQYGGGPADSTTTSAASTATSASNPGVQTIMVGANNAIAYSPNTITAAAGTSVEFVFSPPIHSVTQSSFDSPCAPLANGTGFFSGLVNTASGTNTNVFTIAINDTNPIWFYCAVPTHCELGMVGVINPPSDGSQTLAQYKAAAAKVSNAPAAPSVVQGGTIGPAKAAGTGSSTSSAASASATKSAGVRGLEIGGSVQWALMALTGLVAVGVGNLVI